MPKLIIQIPCFNEEKTLPVTMAELPRELAGFSKVEWLVVDDGSSDRTAQVALECGADYVVRHRRNRGWMGARGGVGIPCGLRLVVEDLRGYGADVLTLLVDLVGRTQQLGQRPWVLHVREKLNIRGNVSRNWSLPSFPVGPILS